MDKIFWPLQNNVIRGKSENNTFGMVRKYANGAARPHQGWDFEAKVQTPAYAIAAGKVAFVRDKGDYGLQLCLSFQHQGDTLYAFYAHLFKVYVDEGDDVEGNDLVAATGESGNAKGMPVSQQHLHFEIRTKLYPGPSLEDRISPLKVFGKCPLTQPIPG